MSRKQQFRENTMQVEEMLGKRTRLYLTFTEKYVAWLKTNSMFFNKGVLMKIKELQ